MFCGQSAGGTAHVLFEVWAGEGKEALLLTESLARTALLSILFSHRFLFPLRVYNRRFNSFCSLIHRITLKYLFTNNKHNCFD